MSGSGATAEKQEKQGTAVVTTTALNPFVAKQVDNFLESTNRRLDMLGASEFGDVSQFTNELLDFAIQKARAEQKSKDKNRLKIDLDTAIRIAAASGNSEQAQKLSIQRLQLTEVRKRTWLKGIPSGFNG